ncbi:MAG TPA: tetratricopeptide repeat protein [Candidatus Rubrimentiphilum sp.]|nr:tetratricopeptide repeat protein [Candidatus Rubrimentiphilum sp.]
MMRRHVLICAACLGFLLQLPAVGAQNSHIVGGVNFDELDLGNGHRLHHGTYTQDDPNITTTLQDVFHGAVDGKVVAVVFFHDELPATGYDESITAFQVENGHAKTLGSIGEFSYYNDSGPYPDKWFYVNFSGGLLYADVWNAETRCDKKHDWIASTYAIRAGKWMRINQLRHHRDSLPFACADFITPSPADAAYNRAVAYEDTGKQPAVAIALWTKALQIEPDDPEALDFRARDYEKLGQYDRAAEDFTREIQARSGTAVVSLYNTRGIAYDHLGKHNLALADFTRAINSAPTKELYYDNRAALLFKMGRYSDSARDFLTVFKMTHNPGIALLAHIARRRAGANDAAEFAANVGGVRNRGAWPDQLIDLYLGKARPNDVISAGTRAGDKCNTQFFVAEWQILQHNAAAAKPYLMQAKTCGSSTMPGYLAAAELAHRP